MTPQIAGDAFVTFAAAGREGGSHELTGNGLTKLTDAACNQGRAQEPSRLPLGCKQNPFTIEDGMTMYAVITRADIHSGRPLRRRLRAAVLPPALRYAR